MRTNTWKNTERIIARLFGGERRGADYRNRFGSGGKNDVIGVGNRSIEIKHTKNPTYGLIKSSVDQAVANRDNDTDVPLAVIHTSGRNHNNDLVFMRLDDYLDFYVSPGLHRWFRQTDNIIRFSGIEEVWHIYRISFLRLYYLDVVRAVTRSEMDSGNRIPVVYLDELGSPNKYVAFRLEVFLKYYVNNTTE